MTLKIQCHVIDLETLLQVINLRVSHYFERLFPYCVYLHNAIVAVNILQIPLLEIPLEYLGTYPEWGKSLSCDKMELIF